MSESQFVAAIIGFLFTDIFHVIKCKNYLELGVHHGGTFNLVAPFCDLAYAIDKENYYDYVKHNPNLRWFQMTTDDFIENILPKENIRFGVIYIDAWHSYEQSLKDFLGVAPYIEENGFILLHDTYPPDETYLPLHFCGDCYRTAEYIRRNLCDDFEIVTFPARYGISAVRKAAKQVLWMK